jgi:hypothetical protein
MTTFFFHIPKTSGTSFKRALESWFKLSREADISDNAAAAFTASRDQYCITGHFGSRVDGVQGSLLRRFPTVRANPAAQVITLLRDPWDHALSTYYHLREMRGLDAGLPRFLERPHPFSQALSLQVTNSAQVGIALRSFFFAGVCENLQATTDALAARLDRPRFVTPQLNSRARDAQASALTEADRRRFEAGNSLDYELYYRVRDAILSPSQSHIAWAPEEQFLYAHTKLRSRYLRTDDLIQGTGILEASLVDTSGAERARFRADEHIGVRITLVVSPDTVGAEPALQIEFDGAPLFVAAFMAADNKSEFQTGEHTVTAWIPPHMLNIGDFAVTLSMSRPNPVQRIDRVNKALVFSVLEAEVKSSRGSWRTPFPGGLRPLLEWRSDQG